MERWQKEQREDIHRMVEEAKEHLEGDSILRKKDPIMGRVWLGWVERYICRRFQYMLRWEWAEAFSAMEDFYPVTGSEALLYLNYARDYARRYVDEKHNKGLSEK